MKLEVELPGARARFTSRAGGVSGGAYATLNLGGSTGDDPELVARNRDRLAAEIGRRLVFVRQVHGTEVLRLRSGGYDPSGEPPAADGVATTATELAPAVLTADCLPVAVAGAGAVAMLHAGWRGLAGGVLGEGVRALRELTGGGDSLAAVIGPGAGPCCYEVGDEVRAAFQRFGAGVRRGRAVDLKAIARAELAAAGVAAIEDLELCTICAGEHAFFSHRRDRGVTGRQAGVAWLT